MSVFKVRYETLGGHTHCRLFAAADDKATWASCGDFTVRNDELESLKYVMAGVTFEDFTPKAATETRLTGRWMK